MTINVRSDTRRVAMMMLLLVGVMLGVTQRSVRAATVPEEAEVSKCMEKAWLKYNACLTLTRSWICDLAFISDVVLCYSWPWSD